MTIETVLAVLRHAADADEIQGVAEDLCAAAGCFPLAGRPALADRLVGQAALVVELRADPRWTSPSYGCD